MKTKAIYLALCVLGAVLPYSAFVPWLIDHGPDVSLFVESLFANRISAFFGLDVIVSALVLWLFIGTEGKRKGVRHLWAPILASLTVGVSLGLPLFLYLSEEQP